MTATWTAPRTWVAHETPTEAMLNAHWRDNMEFLNLVRSATGRFNDLSAATVANLDASALDGVIPLAGTNVLDGVNNYSAGLFQVPVGTDKFDGTAGNKTAGSVWVEGTDLHYVNNLKSEHSWAGISTGVSPGAGYAGFLQVNGQYLRYIDAAGTIRYLIGTYVDSPASARLAAAGILDYLQWIASNVGARYTAHRNVHDDHGAYNDTTPHTDTPGYSDHTDSTSHTDTGGVHTDSPGGHTDVYGDGSGHYDHNTPHTDTTSPHTDTNPHTDSGPHTDYGHTDIPGGHTDTPAYNDHSDQPTVIGP